MIAYVKLTCISQILLGKSSRKINSLANLFFQTLKRYPRLRISDFEFVVCSN
jgi:hypothetical protein